MSDEAQQRPSVQSRGEFIDLARQLLASLDGQSGRSITLIDLDFSPWPLDDAAVVAALTRWIQLPGRRLHLVGGRFDVIERDQPRFAAWRKPFSHAVQCQTPTEVDPSDLPAVLLFDASYLELLDRERWQACWTSERRAWVLQRERLDALMQRCEPAWPVTVLGL
ncbi:MAG TPA: hypothetical protein VFK10_06750 [Burkholderiaceae bacterium]|nr:hypothetical protein [Burkholderiaceae bacterium]